MNKLALAAALSTLSLALIAGPASAADTISVVVPYADLDLTTDAGQAKLDARIDAAIDQICAKPETSKELKAMADWSACRKGAATTAAEQLSAVELATTTFAMF